MLEAKAAHWRRRLQAPGLGSFGALIGRSLGSLGCLASVPACHTSPFERNLQWQPAKATATATATLRPKAAATATAAAKAKTSAQAKATATAAPKAAATATATAAAKATATAAATATETQQPYKQPVWQAAGQSGLLFEYC